MTENQTTGKQRVWTPIVIIVTIIMLVLFFITTYFGYITGVEWVLPLGIAYGLITAIAYYFDTRSKRRIGLLYVTQAAAVFVIILFFVRLQAIFGPNALLIDYLVLGFSMLFAAGFFGIPVYRYTRIRMNTKSDLTTRSNRTYSPVSEN